MLAFHGIGAYRGQRNPLALREMLNGVVSNAICGADRPIRAFGVVVSAPGAIVHANDVWSSRSERKQSLAENDVDVTTTEELREYRDAIMEDEPDLKGFSHHYCELWIEPTHVTALWIKPWANKSTKRAAKILARHRNLPLIKVNGTDRIWDCPVSENFSTGATAPTMATVWPQQGAS